MVVDGAPGSGSTRIFRRGSLISVCGHECASRNATDTGRRGSLNSASNRSSGGRGNGTSNLDDGSGAPRHHQDAAGQEHRLGHRVRDEQPRERSCGEQFRSTPPRETPARVISSRAANGSSNRNSSGSSVSARASDTRIRMPPGKLVRQMVLEPGKADRSDRLSARLRRSALLTPSSSPSAVPRCPGRCATATGWRPGRRSRCAGRRTAQPPVIFSSPADSRSSVDLPHPDGPTTETNSLRAQSD